MQVTVLGAGAWGTALAAQAALRHPTLLWGRDAAQMAEIAATRRNQRYLPDADLPARLVCSGDWDAALAHVSARAGTDADANGAGLVIVATPMAANRTNGSGHGELRANPTVPSFVYG